MPMLKRHGQKNVDGMMKRFPNAQPIFIRKLNVPNKGIAVDNLLTSKASAIQINIKFITSLVDALKIYYYSGDDELNRLAENAFSGCAGTQRKKQDELKEILEVFK